jgi:hypothetical protein
MAEIHLPGIPDVSGKSVGEDRQLRELLLALKISIELITGATPDELDALLNKNT